MSDFNERSGVRLAGEYIHDATIVRVAQTKERRDASVMALIELNKAHRESSKTLQMSDLAAVDPGLTEMHELDHYRVLQSTPFGLLLWRLWQCLAVNMNFVEHQIAAYAPDATLSGGSDILGSAAQKALTNAPAGEKREYLLDVVLESQIYQQIFDWLMDGRGVRVGQFVDCINMAFQLLAIRSEIPFDSLPKWISRRPRDSLLLSDTDFTALELLEAGARAREMILINTLGADDDVVESWRRPRIFGVYAAAFDPLLKQLGEPSWIRMMIDVAFSGDSDLTAAGPELLVEDTLPALRASRLTESLRATVVRNTLEDAHMLVSSALAEKAGLEAPRDVYARLSQKERLFGEGANFGGRYHRLDESGQRIASSPKYDEENKNINDAHFVAAHKRFMRAFDERLTNPIRFIRSDRNDPIAPIIIYYDDTCLFNAADCGEAEMLTLLQTHLNMVERQMVQHLLFNTDVKHLRSMHGAFRQGLIDYGMITGTDEEMAFLDMIWSLEACIETRWMTAGVKQRFARALSLGSLDEIEARWRRSAEVYNASRRQSEGSS